MRPEVAQLIKSVIMVRMHCTVGHFTSRLGSLLDTEASQPVVSVLVELSDLTASLAFFPVPRHLDKRLPRYLVQDRALLIEVNWSLLMVEYTLAELAGHLLGWRICYYRPWFGWGGWISERLAGWWESKADLRMRHLLRPWLGLSCWIGGCVLLTFEFDIGLDYSVLKKIIVSIGSLGGSPKQNHEK